MIRGLYYKRQYLRMEQLTPFNEHLLKIEVINQESVNAIRERINIRYETLTNKQKAKLLAKTIHNMIDHSLPNFSTETKKHVRMELVNKNLYASTLSINAKDIIESSIKYATKEELEKVLPEWVNSKVEIDSNMAGIYIDNLLNHEKKEDNEITHPTEFVDQTIIPIDNNVLTTNQPTLNNKLQKYRLSILGIAALILILFFVMRGIEFPKQKNSEQAKVSTVKTIQERMPNELPPNLQYEHIDDGKLREWLNGRNSLLADEPYYSAILEAANKFNIHPLLLFAITGQEQGFVSKDNKNAEKIANNPFNVYHSWEDFNTNISESSQIAARTIVNLSKGRPKEADPIHWINQKYAEDKNWWKGVSTIFSQLEEVVQ